MNGIQLKKKIFESDQWTPVLLNHTEYRLHITLLIHTPIRFKTIMVAMGDADSYPVHFRNVRSTAQMKDVYKHRVAYRKPQYLLGKQQAHLVCFSMRVAFA